MPASEYHLRWTMDSAANVVFLMCLANEGDLSPVIFSVRVGISENFRYEQNATLREGGASSFRECEGKL